MLVTIPFKIFGLPCLLSKDPESEVLRTAYNVTLVLYGCETWSLSPREEDVLRVFDKMALRIISEPKRKKLTEGWRR